jgi:hypothetical protein
MGPKHITVDCIQQPDGTWKFKREIKTSMTAVTGRTAAKNKRVEQTDNKNVSHPMNVNKSPTIKTLTTWKSVTRPATTLILTIRVVTATTG